LRLLISIPAFLLSIRLSAQNHYSLTIRCVDKDSAFIASAGIPAGFPSRMACIQYVNQLPGALQSKGYITASLDSVHFDSASASVVLFAGDIYKWAQIDVSHVDASLLQATG